MASQPRKFSEKIALHNQKQAEGDAAFQQIMREVTDVTSNSIAKNSKKLPRASQACGGGSLPNVNKIISDSDSPSSVSFLKPSRSNLEDMHCSRLDSNTVYRERGRSVGSGGPMRSRPVEKRVDTSPYSCGPYLSPPSADLSWRRTNSDSALHQSVQNPNNTLFSPGSQRRAIALENQQHYDAARTRHLSVSSDKRPRSCCEVPGIPDINIFPSVQDPDAIQIPIGNNTGSLPDLTTFQFSSPITPLDQDDHQSSTYSSASPQCTSPSTLSPTSLPPRTPGRFSFGGSPPHESSGPPSYASVSPPSPSASKHLSVPLPSPGYLHSPKRYTLDNSPVESNSYQIPPQLQQSMHKSSQGLSQQQQQQQQQSQQQQMMHSGHQQQRSTQYTYQQTSPPQRQSPVSPVDVPSSESIVLNHRNSITSYRSPQSNPRRSPQSSPILNIKHYSNNTSPLSSAPQSPTSSCNSVTSNNQPQSYNSSSDYFVTQARETMQQQFEQIRMLDSPVSSSTDYMISIPNGPASSYQQSDNLCNGPTELTIDQGYFSTSPTQQLQYCTSISNAQTTPTTPNLPEIVFTDCSIPVSGDDSMRRDTTKDLSNCDLSNFFQSEEQLDLDNQLQMLLNDPSQQHFTLNPL